MTVRHDVLTCPSCGYRMDASTQVDAPSSGTAPSPGDLTVCFSCGAMLTYGEGLRLRELQPADVGRLDRKLRVLLTRTASAVRRFRRSA